MKTTWQVFVLKTPDPNSAERCSLSSCKLSGSLKLLWSPKVLGWEDHLEAPVAAGMGSLLEASRPRLIWAYLLAAVLNVEGCAITRTQL